MRLMLWKREFKEKPEIVLSREMNAKMVKGHITNKIGESAVDVSIEELADLTGSKGCCFHPAWMIDGMAAENFTSTSLFVLDFDADKETGKADLEFSRFMEICGEYSIYPTFCYETFSGLPRFRAVFQVNGIVSDMKLWKLCQLGLMKLFNDACDPACKNITQRYFGGKRLIYENYGAFLDPVKLIEAVERKIRSKDVSGHAARAITAFCNSSGIDMVNGSPHIYYHGDENKMAMYYLTDINFNVKWAEGKPKNIKVEREYIDIKDAVDRMVKVCPGLQAYESEGHFTSHQCRYCVQTNIFRVRRGVQWLIDHACDKEHADKIIADFEFWQRKYADWQPQNCQKGCGMCDNASNIIVKAGLLQGKLSYSTDEFSFGDLQSIEEARAKVTKVFEEWSGDIALKAEAGIGKM